MMRSVLRATRGARLAQPPWIQPAWMASSTRSLCLPAEKVSFTFVEEGEEVEVSVDAGKTILEAAHDNEVDLEGVHG